ncbi:hypothetical protein [Streptomyces decoyicus]|uniref:hypothetical protein n=1 Tax=Streptomyces decoyicus TaxID=249567 RepID=UPI00382FADA9
MRLSRLFKAGAQPVPVGGWAGGLGTESVFLVHVAEHKSLGIAVCWGAPGLLGAER